MAVDGFTGIVTTGDLIQLAGHNTKYKVTAHTETTGATTSITFAPGLVFAAVDNDVITTQPHQLEIKIGEGNLSYTEKKARTYTKDRGALDTVRDGDEDPLEVRLDATWEFIRASTGLTPTIEDTLKRRGVAATWVSSSSDACEPYAVDVVVEYAAPCSNEDMEVITLPDFRYEDFAHDAKAGTFSIQGKCNVTEAVVTRVPA